MLRQKNAMVAPLLESLWWEGGCQARHINQVSEKYVLAQNHHFRKYYIFAQKRFAALGSSESTPNTSAGIHLVEELCMQCRSFLHAIKNKPNIRQMFRKVDPRQTNTNSYCVCSCCTMQSCVCKPIRGGRRSQRVP